MLLLVDIETSVGVKIYSYHTIALMGLMFELFGALFVSMEAIGVKNLNKPFNVIKKFSRWSQKSYWRMALASAPLIIIVTLSIIFNNGLIAGLIIPVMLLSFIISQLIDYPDHSKKWIKLRTTDGRIGPIGFVIFTIGAFLQMVSIIWEMTVI